MSVESRKRRGAALMVALVLLVSGCSGGSAGGSDKESGKDAAAERGAEAATEYAEALTSWSTRLSGAVATRKPRLYKKRDPIWPDLRDVLAGEPKLAEVEGGDADPAYDAAQEVASRFGAVHAELTALQDADFDLTGLLRDYYAVYIDTWQDLFDIGPKAGDPDRDLTELMNRSPAEVKRDDIALVKDYQTWQRKTVARLARYERELGAVETPGVLGRSIQAYALEEAGRAKALNQDFLDYLQSTPPLQVKVERYNKRAPYHELGYDKLFLLPWRTRGAVTRELSAMVTTLAGQAKAGKVAPTGPFVGDVYRAQLVRATATRPKDGLKQREWITEQMWLLHRIREIEKTPADLYERARLAVALQDTHTDPRNYFSLMVTVHTAAGYYYKYGSQEKHFPEYKAWALEQLAGPAPDLLEPSRAEFVSWLEKVPTTGPLFERDGPLQDFRDFSTKILERAAKILDDAKQFRPAIVRAFTLTRPDLAARDQAAADKGQEEDPAPGE